MNAPDKQLSLAPGLHADIPMDRYIADDLCPVPTLSSSCAFRLLEYSPAHAWFWHPRLNTSVPRDDSLASDSGSVAHDLLLGGEGKVCPVDPAQYAGKRGGIPKGWTNDAIREARDSIRSRGLIPILKDRLREVETMVQVAREAVARSEIAGVFDSGECELTAIWKDGKTLCRARPDWLTKDRSVMLHYKTTKASAEPASFIRRMLVSMGYDISAAFYERGLSKFCPANMLSVFLVQEQDAPYACSLIGLSPAMSEMAHAKVQRAIDVWGQCVHRDQWPSYPPNICYAEPSSWQMSELEHQLSTPVDNNANDDLHIDMVQA